MQKCFEAADEQVTMMELMTGLPWSVIAPARVSGSPKESKATSLTSRTGRLAMMNAEDAAALERYQKLCQKVEDDKKRILDVKAQIRDQMDRLSTLEGAARDSRHEYHRVLKQDAGQAGGNEAIMEAKRTFAGKEADLAEARAILESLEAELPKLMASLPNQTEMDGARRAAWLAISRDLQARVPKDTHEIVAKAYAALLQHNPEATLQMVLTAIFSSVPSRQECGRIVEQLVRDYTVPHAS